MFVFHYVLWASMESEAYLQMSVSPSSKDLVMASYVIFSRLLYLEYCLTLSLIDGKA
jgi:hypothetical protein